MRKSNVIILGVAVLFSALVLSFPNFFTAGLQYISGTDKKIESDLKVQENQTNRSVKLNTQQNRTTRSRHWVRQDYDLDSLSETEYYVTQRNGTETPFQNEYYDNEREGIYVDVVSGEPLFSSKHKFKSGTGWPHFYKPLEPANIKYQREPGPLDDRIELRSRHADSHLGHLFEDGIAEQTPTGVRFCINSAAIEFIPKEELEQRGYGEYIDHFE